MARCLTLVASSAHRVTPVSLAFLDIVASVAVPAIQVPAYLATLVSPASLATLVLVLVVSPVLVATAAILVHQATQERLVSRARRVSLAIADNPEFPDTLASRAILAIPVSAAILVFLVFRGIQVFQAILVQAFQVTVASVVFLALVAHRAFLAIADGLVSLATLAGQASLVFLGILVFQATLALVESLASAAFLATPVGQVFPAIVAGLVSVAILARA